MALNTCCPAGYVFVDSNGVYIDPTTGIATTLRDKVSQYNTCWQVQYAANIAYGVPVSTIPCGCCPPNYGLVSDSGYLSLISGNVILAGLQYANKCVSYANFATNTTPGDCPCCPDGFIYNAGFNTCVSIVNGAGEISSTIPCIHCAPCLDPPPPPPCPDCGNEALPISFQLNTISKVCTDCPVQDELQIHNQKLISFMPNLLLDPLINFILRQ